MRKQFFLIISLLFLATSVRALSLSTDVEGASGYSSLHIQVSDSKPQDEPFYFSNWHLAAGGSQSKTDDGVTHETTVTRSRDFSLGLGFSSTHSWNFDLSVDSNNTPETKYAQSGAALEVAYRGEFFSVGAGYGGSHIKQKIAFKVIKTSLNRDAELDQKEISAFFSVTPLEWLKIKASGKTDSYSKSKADLQAAYGSRFLNYYSSNLVNSIGGLPENSAALKLTFFISKDWDIEASTENTHLIVDDSNSQRSEIVGTHYFEKWSLGGGLAGSNSDQAKDTSILVSADFEF